MRKIVSSNIVAANAFLSTGRNAIKETTITDYVDKVRKRVNNKTDIFIGGFDSGTFAYTYDFVFDRSDDLSTISIRTDMREKRVLNGYFRRDLPEELIKIMNEEGIKLFPNSQRHNKKYTKKRGRK